MESTQWSTNRTIKGQRAAEQYFTYVMIDYKSGVSNVLAALALHKSDSPVR